MADRPRVYGAEYIDELDTANNGALAALCRRLAAVEDIVAKLPVDGVADSLQVSAILAGDDLNDYLWNSVGAFCVYYVSSGAAAGIANMPWTAAATLFVVRFSSYTLHIALGAKDVRRRFYDGASWGAWEPF